jgi:hypothetical protein
MKLLKLLSALRVFFPAVQPLTSSSYTGLAALYTMITGRGLRELLLCVLLFGLSAPIVGWIMRKEHEQYEKWRKPKIHE